MYGLFSKKVKKKKTKRRRTIYQRRLTGVITLFFTTMSKLWAEFNFYLMWLNFVHLIGQHAYWIFMRFFVAFNHLLQLQKLHWRKMSAHALLKMTRDLFRVMSLAPRRKCPRNVVQMRDAMVALFGNDGSGAPNGNFRENICSEDDLRTRIFGTFVVKFLACLPLLGFSNIYKMV